jgi:hypothetical protein
LSKWRNGKWTEIERMPKHSWQLKNHQSKPLELPEKVSRMMIYCSIWSLIFLDSFLFLVEKRMRIWMEMETVNNEILKIWEKSNVYKKYNK